MTLYHVLLVKYGWHETRLRRVAKWFHLALIGGLVLALVAMPLYNENDKLQYCYISSPPTGDSYRDVLFYNVIPTCLVIFVMAMGVCITMNTFSKKSNGDSEVDSSSLEECHGQTMTSRSSGGSTPPRERAPQLDTIGRGTSRQGRLEEPPVATFDALWKRAFTLLSFCATWGFFCYAQIAPFHFPFVFWLLSVTVTPLFGLAHALVYYSRNHRERNGVALSTNHSRSSSSSPAPASSSSSVGLQTDKDEDSSASKTKNDSDNKSTTEHSSEHLNHHQGILISVMDDLMWDNADVDVTLEPDEENLMTTRTLTYANATADNEELQILQSQHGHDHGATVTGDLMWDGVDSDRILQKTDFTE